MGVGGRRPRPPERAHGTRSFWDWVAQALGRARVHEGAITAAIALHAAALDGESFPGDPADRMLYATAQQQRAPLITRDRALRTFDPLGTVW